MDLQQLRTFVAIAEERNLTRASERLFVSQPAISAQLKSLEEELGVVLFHRVPKGMQLTPSGESLLQDARRTLAAASGLLHHAREMQAELVGRVRIGMNSDAEFLRIVDLQGALCRRHPRLELVFLPGSTVANVPQLRTEALDASFFCGNRDEPQLATWTLFQEDLAVAVPARLREAVGDGDIPTLARQPWI
ncbi:MAG: LysR family transcriptional regulator, partial [Limisphaerales bacterium]